MALVFLIGGIIVLAGITLAFLVNSSIDTGYGYQASSQAEAAATAGAEDALLQLDRNNNFPTGTADSSGYTVPVGSSTASVMVTQSSPSSGYATILSSATVSNRTKKLSVVVAINASTSQVSVVSWAETQ